ncbi:MAG: glycosyltransferase N-terminal domain-containing protein [Bacteroidota bacterium]
MQLLYSITIYTYHFLIWLTSFFNEKAELWIAGRKDIFQELEQKINKEDRLLWMHCASLGEFEQGRPIIEKLKEQQADLKILLTFFSPSGYEIRKNYEQADYVFYLPSDTRKNARRFLEVVQPDFAIFVKYEFWYHYLHELKRQDIPTYLISAIFHSKQPFFSPFYGKFFQSILHCFQFIFVQNESSANLLLQIDIQHFEVVGDTRIDRVLQIAKTARSFPKIEQFKANFSLLICGSTWPPDEAILCPYINHDQSNWRYIFAPHDISESHLQQLEAQLQVPHQRYSQFQASAATKVLIIDNIGLLSQLYQHGKVAYIGGGFGAGIHNTLEPAAFGLPILFGLKYEKFEEAVQLIEQQGAFVVKNQGGFEQSFEALQEKLIYQAASKKVKNYLQANEGATNKILEHLKNLIR